MLLEGRKQPRITKRFLLQPCAGHALRLEELVSGETSVRAAHEWPLSGLGSQVVTSR